MLVQQNPTLQNEPPPPTVQVIGYFYAVDFGPGSCPRHHRVGKDRRCTCGLGPTCPSIQAVTHYLRAGGERAPEPRAGYFPVAPQACPVCGAPTCYVPGLSSPRRGAGWACTRGSESHYWRHFAEVLRGLPRSVDREQEASHATDS